MDRQTGDRLTGFSIVQDSRRTERTAAPTGTDSKNHGDSEESLATTEIWCWLVGSNKYEFLAAELLLFTMVLQW